MEFLRPKDVMKKMKISKPLLYQYVKKGFLPKPVKLSPLLSVWLNSEIEQIMDAMFKKINEDELRKLVQQIENSRNFNVQN